MSSLTKDSEMNTHVTATQVKKEEFANTPDIPDLSFPNHMIRPPH